jgi:acyl-CoA synthetase (AMP-forming)/AMP-acid ligase II
MHDEWKLRQPPAALRSRWLAAGQWTDETFPQLAGRGLAANGGARLSVRSQVRPYDGTIGAVADAGRRLAGSLKARGIREGDVVAFQMPNWSETVACFYGLLYLGAVLVPIVHIYGSKEVGHILRQSRARALITADRFGRQNFLDNLDALSAELPDLEIVVVVDAHGGDVPRDATRWDDFLADAQPLDDLPMVDPDDPVIVGYTSGTTSAPKGVVHTHRTLRAEMLQFASFVASDPTRSDNLARGQLSGSPLSHVTGLAGVLRPLTTGGPMQLIDQWDPAVVLSAMLEDRVASGGGATFFLTSLLDHPDFDPERHLPLMRQVAMGGSPIPADVARRAADLGIVLTRAYGSTEHPSTTMSLPTDPEPKRLFTDGRALPGVELELVDLDGRPVPVGAPGEIHSRGPELFVGYTDPDLTSDALDAEGWYATGDIGILDPDGYLTITDRKKDIIIRGGENVSAAEVEELLQAMPAVAEVAVVAAPDPRYGEHGCAIVRLLPGGAAFDLDAMRAHLEAQGLARQKWPEEVHFVDDFPRTASGKVQKHMLRAAVAEHSL